MVSMAPPVFTNPAPQPISYMPAPVGIYGLFGPPPPYHINVAAPLNQIAIPPRPPPPQAAKKEDKKPPPKKDEDKKPPPKKDDDDKKKKEAPKVNRFAPPPLMPGSNYMFPMEHTKMHIFQKACKVWESKYKDEQLKFKIFYVDTQSSVKSVIERTLGSSDVDMCNGWAISEVMEHGEGVWIKGTTFEYTNDRANGILASMSWDAKRGTSRPPVWVAVHKA
ncbi:hypothetical protein LTR36_003706 [Oleoguttula mirabilis]|uniref:Uncharacterized protein n=1 Tax=Oleoguttula mirabilis TaxID=1507867 RepID=A0AAV9JIB9_9PEZI|nr:hypothetical protein LTR36_003706 [Oleoguttula mirabilis]